MASIIEKLKAQAARLKTEVYALYFASSNPLTPWYAKLLVASIVAYALSPIDLIPDFIPIIGYLDDLILLPLGIMLAIKLIPPTVMSECRQKAKDSLDKAKPVSWVAATIVVFIWLAFSVLTIVWLMHNYF